MQYFQTLWQLVLKEIRSLLGDKGCRVGNLLPTRFFIFRTA